MPASANKLERVRIWGALLLVSVVVLLVAYGVTKNVESTIQGQRRSATLAVCQKQNGKHSQLFEELHTQRVATGKLPRGALRAAQELQTNSREALIDTLEPWEDCASRARHFVR